jgi:hypothetical protein
MGKLTGLIAGFGLGSIATFLLDPDRGRRRRALIRDKMTSLRVQTPKMMAGLLEDAGNRAYGTLAEARGFFHRARAADEPRQGDGAARST